MKSKALIAEFIGTFALVFIGVGAVAADAMTNGNLGLVGVAMAHGLTIAVMVSATAAVSGGHLNPAVTIGLWSAKKINGRNTLGYVIAQLLAGIVAVFALKLIIPASVLETIAMGAPTLGPGITPIAGLGTELILTFFLVFVVYGTAVHHEAPKVGGLFIGLTVALDILMGGPLTGAAMNPARHLGPALLGGGLHDFWIYWLGPLVGGILAARVYRDFLE